MEHAELQTSLPIEEAARLALILALPAMLIFALPFALGWGLGALLNPFTRVWTYVIGVPVLAISVPIHEGLHALGFMLFGGAPARAIRFGMALDQGAVYAHCQVPTTARAYRWSTLLPGPLLGVLPGLAGLWFGSGELALYGILMTISALGDLIAYWAVKPVPARMRVLDHPEQVGCIVLWEEEAAV